MNNSNHIVEVVRKSFSYLDKPHWVWDAKKKLFVQIDENGNTIEVKKGRKKKNA